MKRKPTRLERVLQICMGSRWEGDWRRFLWLAHLLEKWMVWSTKTAKALRAAEAEIPKLATKLHGAETELKFVRAELERMRDDNNWLLQRGFQYDSEGLRYSDAMSSSLRVRFSTGSAWDNVAIEIKERVRYHSAIDIDQSQFVEFELRRLGPMIRDSLTAHILASLGAAINNDLLKERGAAAIAKQKGPRP